MLQYINRFLRPPHFTNEERTRVARLLHVILLVSIAAAAVEFVVLTLIPTGSDWWGELAASAIPFLLVCIVLMRWGHVWLAGALYLLVVWLVMTGACIAGGVFRPSSFAGHIMVILICGFIFDGRVGFFFALLSAAAALGMARGVEIGVLTHTAPDSPLSIVASQTVLYFVAAVIQYMAHNSIQSALARARSQEYALITTNSELHRQIRERRHVENERNRFFELSQDMMGVIDMSGRLIQHNPAFEKVLGYSAEELRQMRVGELIHPDEREAVRAEFSKLQGSAPLVDFQHRVIARDQSVRWLTWRAFTADNRIYVSARDVTEFKRMSEAQQRIEMQRQSMAVKRDFISIVSHQFRTPLAVMLTSAHLLERHHERLTPQERQRYLHQITDQINQMNGMVEQILLINRASKEGTPLQPRELSLLDFCRTLAQQQQNSSGRAISFSAEDDLNPVYMDPQLLGYIFNHLLANALKFSPPEEPVSFTVERDGDYAVFRVIDQGIGILPEDRERIYEPFERGGNVGSVPGHGLGMTIVRSSVEAHHGEIRCESVPGQGTTFVVRLPLDVRHMAQTPPQGMAVPRPAGGAPLAR